MRIPVYALIFALIGGHALADPCADLAKTYSAIGTAKCAADKFAKADASLNEAYQRAVRHLKESKRDITPLVTAERAWINERDALCNHRAEEFDLIDATGAAAIADCKTEWAKARTATLKDNMQ